MTDYVKWIRNPWLGPATLAAAAITMLAWTWDTWCDPIKDFGREIYVAWRLSAGEVLYRDIDYFNGPASPYLNALSFRVLGPSLLNLQLCNLLWWTILTVCSYRLYTILSDRLSAFIAVLAFILLFSFIQMAEMGNYNYMTPYAHELTHAMLCAYAMLLCLHSYLKTGSRALLAGCGALLGLIFLMKAEVTVASAAALGVAFLCGQWANPSKTRWISGIGILAGSALVPPLIAFCCLRLAMPADQAFRGILGAWKYLHDPRITDNPFYRKVLGTDDLAKHSLTMLKLFAEELAAFGTACTIACCTKSRVHLASKALIALATAGGLLGVIIFFWDDIGWEASMRPLYIVTATCCAIWLIALLRTPRESITPASIMRLAFACFALLMLSKIFFKIIIYHYGFALTAPAFSLLVMAMITWLPAVVERFNGTSWVLRAGAMAMLGAFCVKHLMVYDRVIRSMPSYSLGSGPDSFAVHSKAAPIQRMINSLEQRPPGETVATLPEGAMINYLARRVNPTGETTLLPGEVFMYGEDRILHQFKAHPPDWIIAVQCNTMVFGYRGFGIDYATNLYDWIQHNYRNVTPPAAIDPSFPMYLLKRDPAHASTQPAFSATDEPNR